MALHAEPAPRSRSDHAAKVPEPVGDVIFETPLNPRPLTEQAGMLPVGNALHIRYAVFAATQKPHRGTIVLLNGRNEMIEKYFETIEAFAASGFTVCSFDWRGQGGSDRLLDDETKDYIDDFLSYDDDIDAIFQRVVLPDCRGPYFVVAHSAGGLIALHAGPKLNTRVQRMVLLSPLLGLRKLPISTDAVHTLTSALSVVGLGTLRIAPNRAAKRVFDTNLLTTDADRFARNEQIREQFPQLTLGPPTVAWVRAMTEAIRRVGQQEHQRAIRVPTLILASGDDKVVSTAATERFARQMRNAHLLVVNGARHELLQESDAIREQVLAAINAFIPGETGDA